MIKADHARGISFLGHTDQGGRGDGVQVNVVRKHAYVGHRDRGGFSVIDVTDPRKPEPRLYVPAPPNTRSIHLQAHEDLLLLTNHANVFVNPALADETMYYRRSLGEVLRDQPQQMEFAAGLRVYDISRPAEPREIGFMPVDGMGIHRLWYTGGRYAYVSALLNGYTDNIFMVVDVADLTSPREVGRWWIPGMWQAGGESPSWPQDRRYALHHPIIADGIAYGSWRDGGLTLLDISDPAKPALIAHRNWCPPFGGGTHNAVPLTDRGLVVVLDEAVADDCADGIKYVWMVDVREPSNPVTISTFPTPSEEEYCAKGGHFGPHNLHENRPGSFQSSETIFATYQNAGVRVFDIRNAFRPEEVAHYVPPAPEKMYDLRPNRPRVIQTCDVFVDTEGIMYVTDYNAGLYILQYEGA